jgi:multiple antibiotic resistance protein
MRTLLFSIAALLYAGALGTSMLDKYNISVAVLGLAAGVILFLVALKEILKQFGKDEGSKALPESREPRASRLAFPTIVTPWGVAAVIVFCELAQGDERALLTIAGITLAILMIDWLAMLFATTIIRWAQPALEVLAIVFAVFQVALGLQLMLQSLRAMGFPIPPQ